MPEATAHPVHDRSLGNVSYLVEVGGGAAVVVDPPRDVRPHLELAATLGVRPVAVLDTHLHADFVGGARELADATGAEVFGAADAALEYPHRPVESGEELELGDLIVRPIATPGHTPEHLAYLVGDTLLFTGGSITGGGAARTDLIDPALTEELAKAQFGSFRTLARLPDATLVLPTHAGGSFCSAGGPGATAGTLGELRRANPLLAIDDEDDFVRTLLAGYGSFPPYFLHLRAVNRRGAPLVAGLGEPSELDGASVAAAIADGAVLVDARPAEAWTDAHPAGALAVPITGAFATWLGWIVPFNAPLVVLAGREHRDAVLRESRRIGYDRIVGWLGDVESWAAAGLDVRSSERIGPREAARRLADGWTLLDVRQAAERAAERIEPSTHIELGALAAGWLPDTGPIVVHCGHGERSVTAASILERAGTTAVTMPGGPGAWSDAGLPVATG